MITRRSLGSANYATISGSECLVTFETEGSDDGNEEGSPYIDFLARSGTAWLSGRSRAGR